MKTILRILTAPITLMISLLVWLSRNSESTVLMRPSFMPVASLPFVP